MCLFINIMTNESNKICEETNLQKIGNLIKIPYYDLLEESKTYSPFKINGFSIIELDETNEDLYPSDDIPDIETKKGFQLKKKAEYVENYYMNYSEEELSNVHCSKCYMNGFSKNELLYFKDRKSLISYLKYCFIFLKKNLFMNHSIYMNNRYELFKIDHTYLIGFHFLIPKTICKSCFIQLINKKFLLSEMKNEITDYDKGVYEEINTPKKSLNLLKKKRKRKENLIISEKKEKNKDKDLLNSFHEEKAIKSIQISPIVIPLSRTETPKKKPKRKRIGKFGIKRRQKRNNKINIKKYNENVNYDRFNNTLIINKKILKNLDIKEEKEVKSGNLDQIKININLKEKDKIFISSKQEETKEIVDKEKTVKNMNINMNKVKNEKFLEKIKKKKNEKSTQHKNTIIINKINNSNGIGDININKVGLTQINNNNSLSNNLPIIPIYLLNQQKIFGDSIIILNNLEKINLLCNNIYNIMKENPFNTLNSIIVPLISNLIENINNINNKINENRILIKHALLIIKKNLIIYQQIIRDKNITIDAQKLFFLEHHALFTQEQYKELSNFLFEGLNHLNDTIRKWYFIFNAQKGNKKMGN